MHVIAAVLIAILGLAVSGCDGMTNEGGCGRGDCITGLRVDVSDLREVPFQVIVYLPDGTYLEGQCSGDTHCDGLVFEGVTAPTVRILVWEGLDEDSSFIEFNAELRYVEQSPPNEECQPPCRLATVRLKRLNS